MYIQTKYHGKVKVDEEDILYFENGIPGFLDEKKFILLPLEEESPYHILQSLETVELGFIVANPFIFFKEYEFQLSDKEKVALKITSEKDIHIYSILTVKEPFIETTANLQAPIVINVKEKVAKQIIINEPYKTKHNIFPEK